MPLPDILASLQSGIDYERQRGFTNAQGRRRVFSDFLTDSLTQLQAGMGSADAGRRLRAAAQPTLTYSQMTLEQRRAALEPLVGVLQELARRRGGVEGENVVAETLAGLNVREACVAELAVECLTTGKQFSTLVRLPDGVTMPPGATEVTRLTNDMLSSPHLPTFEYAYAQLLEFLARQTRLQGSGYIPLITGHNVTRYDLPLLENQALRSGMPTLQRVRVLDTLQLARSLELETGSNRLGDLYEHFTSRPMETAHRALGDVVANRVVLQALLESAGVWTGKWAAQRSFADLDALGAALTPGVVTWPGEPGVARPRRSRAAAGQGSSGETGPEARQALHAFGGAAQAMSHDFVAGMDALSLDGARAEGTATPAQLAAPQAGAADAAAPGTLPAGLAPTAMDTWRAALASAEATTCFLDAPLASLRAPNKFTTRQLRLLDQAGLSTLRDVLEYYPRDYTACAFGKLPDSGLEGGQPVCLPARLASVTLKPLGSAAMLEISYEVEEVPGGALSPHQAPTPPRRLRVSLQKWRPGPAAQFLFHERREVAGQVGRAVVLAGVVQRNTWKARDQDDWLLAEAGHEVLDGGEESLERLRAAGTHVQVHYGAKGALKPTVIAGAVAKALRALEAGEGRWDDPLPAWVREGADDGGLMPYAAAVAGMHAPRSEAEFALARRRLAFQELFMLQLNLLFQRSLLREAAHDESGSLLAVLARNHDLVSLALRSLPYSLTRDQAAALAAIQAEMGDGSGRPMMSLLQGDVGCGKTVVAFLAALAVAGSGWQVAIMAPTEVLAEQHARGLGALLARLNRAASEEGLTGLVLPSMALVTGSAKRAERVRADAGMADGSVAIAVGTHALLSATTAFRRLGLVVIDEQHRFGVRQRGALVAKARPPPHVLSMSATPIPRSMALLLHGDLTHIVIRQQPPGRGAVTTRVLDSADEEARAQMYAHILAEVREGGQAYIICPLVEGSSAPGYDELRAVTQEHERLTSQGVLPGDMCGVLHGRMSGEEKEAALMAFSSGRTPVLLSTTVVEVGVDVPAAAVMVVEAAERFGLAQLHQLRGRVGRGPRPATCYLLASSGPEASGKLALLAAARDGFEVAEQDFALRGAGDVLGKRQSGRAQLIGSSLKACSLPRDAALLEPARVAAAVFLEAHPSPHGWPRDLLSPVLRHQFLELDLHDLPTSALDGLA